MTEVSKIKPYKTKTKGGRDVIITEIHNNSYAKYLGYFPDEEGEKRFLFWSNAGHKCNGHPNDDINVYGTELEKISENAEMMFEKFLDTSPN